MLKKFFSLPDRNIKTAFAVVILLALALRIGFALTMRTEFYFGDSKRYSEIARNLLDGRGFVQDSAWDFMQFPDENPGPYVAASAPGYPAFLAGCYFVAGEGILLVRILHALIGAVTCLILFRLGSMIFNRATGFAAGLMCAAYPFLVFFSGLVLSETLFIMLTSLFMILVVNITDKPSVVRGIIAGLLAACCIQVRSSFLLFPVALFPILLWRADNKKKFAVSYACVILSMAVFLTPWTVRNRKLLGHTVVTTTRGGMGLYEANGPGANGRTRLGGTPWPKEIAAMGEYERDAFLRAETKRVILENPCRFLLLALKKVGWMWNVVINYEVYRTGLYNTISLLSYLPVMLFGAAAVVIYRRNVRNWLILAAPALYLTTVHMVFLGSIRYRLPAMPFLIVLCAAALVRGHVRITAPYHSISKVDSLRVPGAEISEPCPEKQTPCQI